MKKLLFTLAFLGLVLQVSAQSKSVAHLKEKYQGHEDFFNMELGGNFLNFAEGFKIDLDEDDMATVAKSLEKMNFFKLPEGSDADHAEFRALQKGLQKERYDLLMEAAEGKTGVMVYSKGARTISDLVVLVGGDEGDLMVVELKGSFAQEMVEKAMAQRK
ncbi:DUF4252 domain-containing protein [Algoriphagus hitonicola]|uniref:DUF4252 domain-containing protein n=1 Tax=Algoriphagus hitonicola TaxID=435880 RepID=A0A1I2W2U9_9BACT|nr:DUF4252 domain-containing protein [Algoriphagus hitonicola]SFG95683.1 protein of unknown function [Algoriphagus hitonicola]